MRMALIIEYEGTEYHGFQYQANAPSVQAELEKAISRLTGEKTRIKAAGRTDAGVHAKGQVVAFDTMAGHAPGTFVKALNFYLPDDIAVRAAYRVADDFDPRRRALSRRYRYTVLNSAIPSPLLRRTTCLVREPLRVGRMRMAARLFLGSHDFRAFSGPLGGRRTSTVRQVYDVTVRACGELVTCEVEGNAFLPQQVRRMVGALVDLGRGRLSLDDLKAMIDGGKVGVAAGALPPQGLCLLKVTYPDFPPEVGELDDNQYQVQPGARAWREASVARRECRGQDPGPAVL